MWGKTKTPVWKADISKNYAAMWVSLLF